MSDWLLIIYCGLITYFTRFSMIAILKKEMFNDRIREVLSYVPAAIFPAIIFPAIFLDNVGEFHFENNPKILASIIAGNIADGTNDSISLILSLNISFFIKVIIVNLVRYVTSPQYNIKAQLLICF